MRRGRRRAKDQPLRGEDLRNTIDSDDALRLWVLGLPYVHERVLREGADPLREFVVDCPPLRISRVWLMMRGGRSHEHVLAFITHEDGDVSCISFDADRAGGDARHVEAGLLLAYESAFASPTF